MNLLLKSGFQLVNVGCEGGDVTRPQDGDVSGGDGGGVCDEWRHKVGRVSEGSNVFRAGGGAVGLRQKVGSNNRRNGRKGEKENRHRAHFQGNGNPSEGGGQHQRRGRWLRKEERVLLRFLRRKEKKRGYRGS